MQIRSTLALAGITAALVTLGSCASAPSTAAGPATTVASGSPTSAPTSVAATTQPTSPTVCKATTTIGVGGTQVHGWPTGVTLPSDAKAMSAVTTDSGGTVTFSAPVDLANHLKSELLKAGFKITVDTGTTFTFSGQGWEGTVTGGDTTVMAWAIDCGEAGDDGTDGATVQAGQGGATVQGGGATVKAGQDGATVQGGGATVKAGPGGVTIEAPGVTING